MQSFRAFLAQPPQSLPEDWGKSWSDAGNAPQVKATAEKFKKKAKMTALSIGSGTLGAGAMGIPGGPPAMALMAKFGAALGTGASIVTGNLPGAVYQGGKYLAQRALQAYRNEKNSNGKKSRPSGYKPQPRPPQGN